MVGEGDVGRGLRAPAVTCAERTRTRPGVEPLRVQRSEPGELLSVLQNPKSNVPSLPSLSRTDSPHFYSRQSVFVTLKPSLAKARIEVSESYLLIHLFRLIDYQPCKKKEPLAEFFLFPWSLARSSENGN